MKEKNIDTEYRMYGGQTCFAKAFKTGDMDTMYLLAKVDVKPLLEKKGKLNYLS